MMVQADRRSPLPDIYPIGSPYNTGDGIPIAQRVGAKMRHMGILEFGSHCVNPASKEMGFALAVANELDSYNNLIAVNKNGNRFMNETACNTPSGAVHPTHDKNTLPEFDFDGRLFDYKNLPYWFIFDDTRCKAGALASWASPSAKSGWAIRKSMYLWSDDNSTEIEKGWIVKADTLEELAEAIGIDSANLVKTVEMYNAACEKQSGDEFGRENNLTPINTPPYYAAEMAPCFINAQGGPERNGSYQVMTYDDVPIPRLYAAGEFGSINGREYPGGLNVPEAMCGYAAGANAAGLDPWE